MGKYLLITTLLVGNFLQTRGSLEEAENLFDRKNYPLAKEMLLRLAKKPFREAKIPFYLGMIASMADRDYNQAIRYFQEAIELEPARMEYRLQLVFAWKKKGQRSNSLLVQYRCALQAKKALDDIIATEPNNLQAHQLLLQYYLVAPSIAGGNIHKAQNEANILYRLNKLSGLLALESVFYQKNQLMEAKKYYELYLKNLSATNRQLTYRIDFTEPMAKRVYVAGDFTDWEIMPLPMYVAAEGRWFRSCSLSEGRHQYMLIVDGHWTFDTTQTHGQVDSEGNITNILHIP